MVAYQAEEGDDSDAVFNMCDEGSCKKYWVEETLEGGHLEKKMRVKSRGMRKRTSLTGQETSSLRHDNQG